MADVSDADALIESFDVEPGYLDWARFGPLSPSVRTEMSADAELLGGVAVGRRRKHERFLEHRGAIGGNGLDGGLYLHLELATCDLELV